MSRSAPRLDAGQEEPGPDQPVRLVDGVLAEQPLLEAGGEDVGDRLVERARLALVDQPGGVLGDRVGELVAEHVDRLGEPVEDLAVAVAEDQLRAVPERVVVVAPVVDGRDTVGAGVVVRVAVVDLGEQRQRRRRCRPPPRRRPRPRTPGHPAARTAVARAASVPVAGGVHDPVGHGGRPGRHDGGRRSRCGRRARWPRSRASTVSVAIDPRGVTRRRNARSARGGTGARRSRSWNLPTRADRQCTSSQGRRGRRRARGPGGAAPSGRARPRRRAGPRSGAVGELTVGGACRSSSEAPPRPPSRPRAAARRGPGGDR